MRPRSETRQLDIFGGVGRADARRNWRDVDELQRAAFEQSTPGECWQLIRWSMPCKGVVGRRTGTQRRPSTAIDEMAPCRARPGTALGTRTWDPRPGTSDEG
ncbi:hypothetical protein RJ55_05325 [Drechmeria coniospora]|nr:hypothetical protein RJ55_05325 [Drechmeria coniospora]